MSLTISYPFTSGTSYTYDSAKIDFTGVLAKLKTASAASTFTQAFTSDSGFTYDSTKAEFTGGLVRQKLFQDTNSSFFANYASSINATYSTGSGTGTAFNGAAVSGGKLVLDDLSKYVTYVAAGNADVLVQTGCVRLRYTPNFSGAPGTLRVLFTATGTSGNTVNYCAIYHQTDNTLRAQIYNSAGTTLADFSGAYTAVSGTEVEIELDFDVTAGANRLFLNGTQIGSTNTSTGSRTSAIGYLALGNDGLGTRMSGSLDNVQIFSTVQHTSNYTVSTPYIYRESAVTLPTFTHVGTAISAFTSFTAVDSNTPHYVIGGKYYNGSAWVVSDSSFAQSNTAATVNTNIATLTPSGLTLVVKTVFENSESVQMSTDNVIVGYTGVGYATDNPSITANSTFSANDIVSASSTFNATGSDLVKFQMIVNNQAKYYTSSWVNSDGTYAQSNTYSEITTNIGTLLTGSGAGVNVRFRVFLHSADGSTTPDITEVEVEYDFQSPSFTSPATCIVYGFLVDSNSTPIVGATVKARPKRLPNIVPSNSTIILTEESTTTDSNGYWELDLIQSASLEDTSKYDFTILQTNGLGKIYNRTVPAEETAIFEDLVP